MACQTISKQLKQVNMASGNRGLKISGTDIFEFDWICTYNDTLMIMIQIWSLSAAVWVESLVHTPSHFHSSCRQLGHGPLNKTNDCGYANTWSFTFATVNQFLLPQTFRSTKNWYHYPPQTQKIDGECTRTTQLQDLKMLSAFFVRSCYRWDASGIF